MKWRYFKSAAVISFLLGVALEPLWAQKATSSRAPGRTSNAFRGSVPLEATGRTVAVVNGAVLTDRDLLREMYAIFPYARQHHGSFPKLMEADIRRGALKMIEFEELVYQEALRRKMTIAPARLNKAEASFRAQFSDHRMYEIYLKTECQGSRKVLRGKIRRSLLIDDLLKREVTDKSAVSVAQAKAWYRSHPQKFRIPESYAVQTISAMAPPKATPQQVEEARQRALKDLPRAQAAKTYEQFGLLAQSMSEDDYRVMMGDHRLVPATELPAEILAAVRKMQPGEVSNVIQVGQVFTIVRLMKHVPAGMKTFAEVRNALLQQLETEKVERLRTALNLRLRKGAKIVEEP